MKLLYIVNTHHDEAAYRAYAKVHMDARVTPAARVISALFGLIIAAGGVLAIVRRGFNIFHPVTILLGVLCIFAYPLGRWRMEHNLTKRARDMTMHIDYRFGEDTFSVSYPGENSTIPYDQIQKIVETDDYFFVYTDVRMAHILKKADFTQGDPATFAAFLKEKSGVDVTRAKA